MGGKPDFTMVLAHSMVVKGDLLRAGWIINTEISQWYPTLTITWIGYMFDLTNGILKFRQKCIEAANRTVNDLLSSTCMQAKHIQSVIHTCTM